VYLIALQKQPPVRVKGVEGRDAMVGFGVAGWGIWQLICWESKPNRTNYIPSYA
jgi:hypothetical protein